MKMKISVQNLLIQRAAGALGKDGICIRFLRRIKIEPIKHD